MDFSPPHDLAGLLDRAAISDLVFAYARGIDRRDWRLYRSIFADRVDIDFSTWAGTRETVDADAWVASVRDTLACFDATQHRMTNVAISVDGDTSVCVAEMTARHVLVVDGLPRFQMLGGYYTDRCVRTPAGWRIVGCALTITWEEGDRGLFAQAHALGPRARVDVGTQGV